MAKGKIAFTVEIQIPQHIIDEVAESILEDITGGLDDVIKDLKIKPAAVLKELKADAKFLAATEKEIRRQLSTAVEDLIDPYEAYDNVVEELGTKHSVGQLRDQIYTAQQRLESIAKEAAEQQRVDSLIQALESRGYFVSRPE
jgi:hypothetical protein